MKSMVKEKRLRILHDEAIPEGEIGLNPKLKNELDIKTKAEVVVAKKRFVFKVKTKATLPEDKIFGNPEDLLKKGIQNNSIATVRAPLN